MRISNMLLVLGLGSVLAAMGAQLAGAQSAAQSAVQQGDPAQQKVSTTRFETQCPEEVRTKQAPAAPIKGWATHVETVNSRQIFTAAYLYEGHPKDGVQLMPMADTAQQAALSAGAGTTYAIPVGKDIFLVCYYGNTLVRLIHKIPKGVNSCVVKYSETLGHVQKAVCE
jgi:hypothetical protein